MGSLSLTSWAIGWGSLAVLLRVTSSMPSPDHHEGDQHHHHQHSENPKLLYILMDGFRWDYVDKQSKSELPNFDTFLSNGVKARWTNPLFPSLSFPTWTSLVTGQYAETHGVIGNYFYDAQTKEKFSLFNEESTGKQKWWTSEPIWTTAEKAGLKTAQYLWARCDVPIDGVRTDYCEHFIKIPGKDIFLENIMNALEKFDQGYDFVQVYTEHTDHTGHNYGPDSQEVLQAVRDLDDVMGILMKELEKRELDDVNIVIVSDHGMANTAPGTIARHEIDDYLDTDLVENIADKGAIMNIKAPPENIPKVYEQLSAIPGINVYKKEDIPEKLHYKKGKYVNDILIMAKESEYGNIWSEKQGFTY
ncbi:Ectonucleotide pyrophosphatase/phosphodiesterase member 6 [Halocaridina rubra]|uniref:Ectonucleotide pyrophosphatase/phosphodiesterase member 6 n=1 Tax=Halocaridina rubra TaxID=373956 RepID=A0AAN8WRM3_HALRR